MAPGSVAITDESGRELPAGQDGIIWFTRPANKFSYHNDPEKSASMFNDRGWARMGDLGHLDDDGYLFITGRSDHTIISGGVNIYPREIEDLLIAHPAVDDVAVIGVPDDEYGESVMAVVTLRDGYAGGAELERDIIDWTRARLAHYKCPKSVTFVDSLPRSVAGQDDEAPADRAAASRSHAPNPTSPRARRQARRSSWPTPASPCPTPSLNGSPTRSRTCSAPAACAPATTSPS